MASIRKRHWTSAGEVKVAWVLDYKDQNGKRRSRQFARKKEAERFRTRALNEIQRGTHTPDSDSVTVAEAAELWLAGKQLEGLERSTIRFYRQHVDHHIAPLIGQHKLARLTAPGMVQVRDELLRTRSRPMARNVMRSLSGLLADAMRRGLVAQNVAHGVSVRIPKREQKGIIIPTKDEVRAILDHASGRWRPLVVTAIFTGMRASELRGLAWDNVDFLGKTIWVRQRADRWGEIGPPKSAAGRRDIPMTPMVENTLRALWQKAPPSDLALVFPNGRGRILSQDSLNRHGLHPLLVECGIVDGAGRPKYGFHALRHFYASWLIDEGFPPKRIQAILGHSTIGMTFDTYGHLFPAEDDRERLAAGELTLVA